MKVKFLTNLGTRDAAKYGVDLESCQVGAECQVSKATGQELLALGWVEVLPEPEPPAEKKIKTVAKKPAIAEAKNDDAEAKDEPKPKAAKAAKSSPKPEKE